MPLKNMHVYRDRTDRVIYYTITMDRWYTLNTAVPRTTFVRVAKKIQHLVSRTKSKVGATIPLPVWEITTLHFYL